MVTQAANDDASVPSHSSAKATSASDDETLDVEMEDATTFSPSIYLSMLASDDYDKSSRYLRNIVSLGAKR